VAHYLKLGADEIYIYLDDLGYNSIDQFQFPDNVFLIECDGNYWDKHGGVPAGIEKKQCYNYADARGQMTSQWSLHVDVDELLYSNYCVGFVLGALPIRVFSVLVRPLEAVYSGLVSKAEVYNTQYFKRQIMDREFLDNMFGSEWVELGKRGFFAHDKGKSFVRTSHEIEGWYIHTPSPKNKSLLRSLEVRGIELLHFECQDPESFLDKIKRRINGSVLAQRLSPTGQKKLEMFKSIYEKDGEQGLLTTYKKLNVFRQERLAKCVKKGFIVERFYQDYGVDTELDFLPQLSDWKGRSLKYIENDRRLVFSNESVGEAVGLALSEKKMILFVRRENRFFHLIGKEEVRLSEPGDTLHADAIYSVERTGKVKFLIRLGDSYFKSNRNGDFILGGTVAKKWEVFRSQAKSSSSMLSS
jgi:hypothetical protein